MTAPSEAAAIDTLARTLYGEAANQGRAGMAAVASVVLNRVKHPGWWGHDISSVCLDPWQFSCWNSDNRNLPRMRAVTSADPYFRVALDVATQAVTGKLPDTVGNANSYYAFSIPAPGWTVRAAHVIDIGYHSFWQVQSPAPATCTAANPHGHPDAPTAGAVPLNSVGPDRLKEPDGS